MTENENANDTEKTPLQAVVSVICDAICELPVDDRRRALMAAHVILFGVDVAPAAVHEVPDSIANDIDPSLAALLGDLLRSLQPAQVDTIRQTLDVGQVMMLSSIATLVMPATASPPSIEAPTAPA